MLVTLPQRLGEKWHSFKVIRFHLVKSNLVSGDKSPYFPKTIQEGNTSLESVIKDIAYGSTVTEPDVIAVLKNIERVCTEHLTNGRSVNLGFCTLRPQVKGNFKKPEESYSNKKHWIEISVAPNLSMEKRVSKFAKVTRINRSNPQPSLKLIKNCSRENGKYLAGDLLILKGSKLRFPEREESLGVFFVKKGVEKRVTEYSNITSSQIGFKIPNDITADSYKIVVKNNFGTETRQGELLEKIKIT